MTSANQSSFILLLIEQVFFTLNLSFIASLALWYFMQIVTQESTLI